MSDEETQGQERDLGKRIASLIQSIGHGPRNQLSGEELGKLKAAMGRLDQMLKDAADADRQALREAAGRLDRLLGDLRKGKGATNHLRRRETAP